MAFNFRQFVVHDEQSTQRVGTDAMLLGAWINPGSVRKVLDIGTGCGVLALMMAQQCEAQVDAIDIDGPSIFEAKQNFLNSPWNSRINAINASLAEFGDHFPPGYDLIITNPPYFSKSLKSPSARKNQARHDDCLSLTELVSSVKKLLAPAGRFALILPAGQAAKCIPLCLSNTLHLTRRTSVHPKPAAPAKRVLLEFSLSGSTGVIESELNILDASGKFSYAYLSMTGSFHNF